MKREYTYDDYLEETFGDSALNRHKTGDRIKWVLTLIAFVLIAVTLAGILLGWFSKTEVQEESAFIEVGDEVAQLYLNKNKSVEEITSMYAKLDKSNSVEGDNSSFRFIKLIEFTDGSNLYLSTSPQYHLYFVGTDGNLNSCWPFGFSDEDYYEIDRSGTWNTKTVKAVYQQDIWKDFIAAEPFDAK